MAKKSVQDNKGVKQVEVKEPKKNGPTAREVAEFLVDNLPIKFVGRAFLITNHRIQRVESVRGYTIRTIAAVLDAYRGEKLVLQLPKSKTREKVSARVKNITNRLIRED